MDGREFFKVYQYQLPEWAQHLLHKPTHYVKLSNLNTPVHEWNVPGVPSGYEIFIKRDDLTGTELSGNKVRVVQLMLAEALNEGAKCVVTGGGPQSGNCRAVSLVCRQLGLKPFIVIEGAAKKEDIGSVGNALLYRMAGSNIYLAPTETYEDFKRRVLKMKDYISAKYGEQVYYMPVGLMSVTAVHAYVSMFDELMKQGIHERFDDIFLTVATGGTALGLAVGNLLSGSRLKIHAVSCALTRELVYKDMNPLLQAIGLKDIRAEDILDVIEGYVGEKYGTATEEGLDYIANVCAKTGILLDPYYTGKGTMGMVGELQKNPSRFQGKRILFIHTGGIFGLFNGEMDRVIDKEGSVTNNITPWPDENTSPL